MIKDKAYHLSKVFELSRREAVGESINNPAKAFELFHSFLANLDVEHILLMMLDNNKKVIDITIMSKGTVNRAILGTREIFIEALNKSACNIILAHNHPSGDTNPSREDFESTSRVCQAGNILGLELLDHIVVGRSGYTSIRECNPSCFR
jgi:DNA repair protein RadC